MIHYPFGQSAGGEKKEAKPHRAMTSPTRRVSRENASSLSELPIHMHAGGKVIAIRGKLRTVKRFSNFVKQQPGRAVKQEQEEISRN